MDPSSISLEKFVLGQLWTSENSGSLYIPLFIVPLPLWENTTEIVHVEHLLRLVDL